MTEYTPPSYQFTGLNYNPQFFEQPDATVALDTTKGDARYLQRIGNPTSIATATTFTGSIVANAINTITTLSIGGVSLYDIFLTTSNAVNDNARKHMIIPF